MSLYAGEDAAHENYAGKRQSTKRPALATIFSIVAFGALIGFSAGVRKKMSLERWTGGAILSRGNVWKPREMKKSWPGNK